MKSSLFIGVDIAKDTLDVSVLAPSDSITFHYHRFANQQTAFRPLLKWSKQHSEGVGQQHWRGCMENTGLYSLELNCFLQQRGIWQSMANTRHIKRSMGGARQNR